ncbi:short chain dehydrogenase [Colletotrichum graminicola]|uniref:Short chain dehydrogenase n=1 Tax=Colletotrichum graminicola (strain M1.001 / M2 / FGSC 10212) TaxID=645133 RepID=E3QST5_COLGM|nr:short chain dehydrogenase [Colletotrichum graminicola M1.001]EFQ33923.1 short chain dehydrogenase [Colletotrichum graminicola M1.001]WDK21113.1 short chain dehydrogenase [Colletotrichum graminicola]
MSRYAAAHANPQGPGDARPTALQVVEDEGLVGKLAGTVVLITGANAGIGLETARAVHATGATLFLTARDSTKARQAIDGVKNGPGPNSDAPVHAVELRLDSLASVRSAAKEFLSRSDRLNVLILNAGVMATPEGRTEDGFETQFGTNHLGHFLFFQLLKPALLASSTPRFQSRVVSVSSMAHHRSNVRLDDVNFEKETYRPWTAYGRSKTANILFAKEAERRYGLQGLHALSLHPGVIVTNLLQYLPADETEAILNSEAIKLVLKSAPQGAATSTYAALSPEWEGRGGKYLSNLVKTGPSTDNTGYALWIDDEQLPKELWDKSNELVGFDEK